MRMTNIKLKRIILIVICSITVFMSLASPFASYVSADEAEDKNKVTTGVGEYTDGEEGVDLLDKFSGEDQEEIIKNRNNIKYVLYRVLSPQYLNNTSSATIADELKATDPRDSSGYTCNPNSPQNLLNHNCNIPNFAAEFLQVFTGLFDGGGIKGATPTQSKATLGFGVPVNIPGGEVPANVSSRTEKYTALELYGYKLKWTTYGGEWDHITTSTEARMLTNFGMMDKFKMVGRSLWNGIKGGVGSLIEGFDWNPIRWASNVFSSAAGATFNSIIDTSDLNVIATNSWRRESFNSTLYNVYVLTDRDVINASAARFTNYLVGELAKQAEGDPNLLAVLALESPPDFTYDPELETEASIEAREAAQKTNEENKIKQEADPNYQYTEITVPEKVYKTEEEQFADWKVDNEDFLNQGKAAGLYSNEATYEELVSNWTSKWEPYMKKEFNFNNEIVTSILSSAEKAFFLNDPYGDPKQPISHYVCADDYGKPLYDSNGNYEYLYTSYNDGATENINSNCKAARPSIRGAYFGDGWHTDVAQDTRYTTFKESSFGIDFLNIGGALSSFFSGISSFIAQFTNEMLSLSFEPILTKLGIVEIVEGTITSFRDSVFLPMTVIAAAVGAFMIILQVIRTGKMGELLLTIGTAFLIFFVGTMILMKPKMVVSLIDDVPYMIDNLIADTVLSENNSNQMCTTDGKNITDGIRSAQCSVWETMVFTPWVYGQFGVGYDQLYANGYGSGNSFNNDNTSLVGNADVNMGGGKIENNWALYQLDKTKTGTITNTGEMSFTPSSDMYRLVDLQAGPNNGALSDSSYFDSWKGNSSARLGVAFTSVITSILSGIAIISIAFKKIEFSFLFGLGLIFLPFMLLRGFSKKGQHALKNYVYQLASLFGKRLITTLLLVILLRLFTAISSTGLDYGVVSVSIMCFAIAFMMYKKELIDLLGMSGSGVMGIDGKVIKESLSRSVPLHVRNRAQIMSQRVRGYTAGTLGGALAGFMQKPNENDNVDELGVIKSGFAQRLDKAREGAKFGAGSGLNTLEGIEMNKMRRRGFSVGQVISESREHVLDEGSERITENYEATAADVYRDLSSETKFGKEYSGASEEFSRQDARVIRDAKTQKQLRKEAEKRKRILAESNDLSDIDITNEDINKAVDKLDKNRERVALKDAVRDPIRSGVESVKYVMDKETTKDGKKLSTRSMFKTNKPTSKIDKTTADMKETLKKKSDDKEEE